MAGLSSQLNETMTRAEDMQADVGRLEDVVGNLTGKMAVLMSRYESRNESCEAAELSVTNLTQVLSETQLALTDAMAERDQLQNDLNASGSQLDDLRKELDELMAEVDLLEDENAVVQSKLSVAMDELDVIRDSINLGGEISRKFQWNYLGARSLQIGGGQSGSGFNRSEYIGLATGRHIEDTDYDGYAGLLGTNVEELGKVTEKLDDYGATELQRANYILKFVQYLPYIHDCNNDNYVRYPLETLIEGGGDCEDTSVLAAELLLNAGYRVVLLTVDTNNNDEVDHMMVGLAVDGATGDAHDVDGVTYYLCETTSSSYRVGQRPHGYVVVDAISIS
jgi:hypothetical protein